MVSSRMDDIHCIFTVINVTYLKIKDIYHTKIVYFHGSPKMNDLHPNIYIIEYDALLNIGYEKYNLFNL